MSLKDEVNKIRKDNEPNYYTDEEVYDFLIKKMYKEKIKDPIKSFFTRNPTQKIYSSTTSISSFEVKVVIPDYKEFANYRWGAKDYKKVKIEAGYDQSEETYIQLGGFSENFVFNREGIFGKNRMIELTPMGKKIYETLKKMASKDGVEMDIKGVYTYGISEPYFTHKNHRPKSEYHELGEWFSNKKPANWRNGYDSADVEVTIKFEV